MYSIENNDASGQPLPVIVPRADHPISRANISPSALRVLYRLREGGFQAFLVGGAVRDLLLGLSPKDFDIATDAHPEQVRKLFRNCRLIGRRFHLAHVRFGPEIIEVATFRAAHTEVDEDNSVDEVGHRVLDEHGRILRDNLYGTIEEDVWRRDFTANALYYNIEDYSIWDYVGGVPDASARVLRMIGDPETRYREDPVRMLRAARFAAKLGFTLHPDSEAPVHKLAYLLDGVPPARLFDETMKLLLAGSAAASCNLLARLGLLGHLMPDLVRAVNEAPESAGARLVQLGPRGYRRTRARRQVRDADVSLRGAAVARDPARGRGSERTVAGGSGGSRHGLRHDHLPAAAPHRHPEAVHDADARHHHDAAALRAPRRTARRALPRASAISRGLRFPAAARGVGRDRSGARGVVDAPAAAVAGRAHRGSREPAGTGDGRGREGAGVRAAGAAPLPPDTGDP